MSVLFQNTSPYNTVESWLYERVIAPAVMEPSVPGKSFILDNFRDGAKILEVGCGGGRLADRIAQSRSDVSICGVDLSPDQVARAKKRCNAWGDRVTFVQGTALNLQFTDDSFDAVISVASVKHWPDKAQGLRECVRVLRPSGVLIVIEVDRGCPIEDARAFVNKWRIAGFLKPLMLRWFRTFVVGQGIDCEEARTLLDMLDLSGRQVASIPKTPSLLMYGRKKG